MQSECRDAVLEQLPGEYANLSPEVLGWIDYLCSQGNPPILIAEEVRMQLAWDKLLASINAGGYVLSPEDLRDLWRRFKSGELTAKGVLEEAKILHNPPGPKLKIR